MCPEYCLSILIWVFSSVFELSFASRLNMTLLIAVKVLFVRVLPLIYPPFLSSPTGAQAGFVLDTPPI